MLKKADYDRIIQIAKEAIEREWKSAPSLFLKHSKRWERRGDWGDVSFMTEQGQHIDAKWLSSAMKMARSMRWLLPPRDFACHGHRVLHSVAPERSANVAVLRKRSIGPKANTKASRFSLNSTRWRINMVSPKKAT